MESETRGKRGKVRGESCLMGARRVEKKRALKKKNSTQI